MARSVEGRLGQGAAALAPLNPTRPQTGRRAHHGHPVVRLQICTSTGRDIDKADGLWDEHRYLMEAMQLSRLIRDNAYSTEYACRVIEHADGMKQVEQPSKDLSMFSSPCRLGTDRDWDDNR